MEFAKYYNVTPRLQKLLALDKLLAYEPNTCKELYICLDTHDFWVARVIEGMNSEFEEEAGTWLIERNKIDHFDICNYISEKRTGNEFPFTNRRDKDHYISTLNLRTIVDNVILFDDEEGLSAWDNIECDSHEECIRILDSGNGILELDETKIS